MTEPGRISRRPPPDQGGLTRPRSNKLRRRHRTGGPRPAPDAIEDVLRMPDDVRRAAQLPDLPGLSGHARRAAGRQPAGGRVRHPHGARVQLPRQRGVPLRAQALLLPGHAEELPDQPVRGAPGRGRLPRDSTSTATRAGSASSGSTSKRTSASSSTRARSRRPRRASSTSTARAWRSWRPCRGPSCVLPRRPPTYLRAFRAVVVFLERLRRQHGGGLASVRRERLVAPAGPASSSAPRSRSRT